MKTKRSRIGWYWEWGEVPGADETVEIDQAAWAAYEAALAEYESALARDRAWALSQPCGWSNRGPSPELSLVWAVWSGAKDGRPHVYCEPVGPEPDRPDWRVAIVATRG